MNFKVVLSTMIDNAQLLVRPETGVACEKIMSLKSAMTVALKSVIRTNSSPGLAHVVLKFKKSISVLLMAALAAYYKRMVVQSFLRTWLKRLREKFGPRIFTWSIFNVSSSISADYRRLFKENDVHTLLQHDTPKHHSHPGEAVERCKANTFMNNFVTSCGKTLYSVEMSTPEAEHDVRGTRHYHVAKDLQMKPKRDPLLPTDVIKMTDVDYYVNMPSYLNGHMLILYTFVPDKPAGVSQESTYCTLSNGNIEMVVNGGARYEHPLWDYDTDHVVVDHWWGSMVYLVEAKQFAMQRRVYLFVPVRTVYTPLAWLIPGRRLSYRELISDGVAYVKSQKIVSENMLTQHSYAPFGSTNSVTISDTVRDAIRMRCSMAKDPQISDIERILKAYNVEDSVSGATLLTTLWRATPQVFGLNTRQITPCIVDAVNYQAVYPLVTEDGKPVVRPIAPAYAEDAYAPRRSLNNDTACLQGRIHDVKNKVKTYPPFYVNCITEFVELLIPKAHIGVPYDQKFVEDRMTRPAQRAKIAKFKQFAGLDSKWSVSSFQKAETYGKITHPRNISTVPTDHLVRFAGYCYALSDKLKEQHWYGSGKHPKVLSDALYTKTATAQFVTPSDISRMDGSMGPLQTALEKAVFARFFPFEYHQEITRLLKKQEYAKAFTAFSLMYDTTDTTLSGSSDTTLRNTLANAFACYVALRSGGLFSPAQAFAKLGLYSGDDGLTPDLCPALLARVFAKMGFLCEAERVNPGNPVRFLGRIYVDPWTGPESIADVPRQLGKLHLTIAPKDVPNDLILRRKAEGILVTDPKTPFLTEWAKAIIRVCPPADPLLMKRYKHLIPASSYWDTFECPFYNDVDESFVMGVVANELGITAIELKGYMQTLDAATKLSDLDLGIILPRVKPPQIAAAIGGVLVTPALTRTHDQKIARALAPLKSGDKNLISPKKTLMRPSRIPIPLPHKRKTPPAITRGTPKCNVVPKRPGNRSDRRAHIRRPNGCLVPQP